MPSLRKKGKKRPYRDRTHRPAAWGEVPVHWANQTHFEISSKCSKFCWVIQKRLGVLPISGLFSNISTQILESMEISSRAVCLGCCVSACLTGMLCIWLSVCLAVCLVCRRPDGPAFSSILWLILTGRLSVCLAFYQSAFLSACLAGLFCIFLSVFSSVCLLCRPSICLSVWLACCPAVCLPFYISVWPSVSCLSACLTRMLSIDLFTCQSIYRSLSPFFDVSSLLYLCLSGCLSACHILCLSLKRSLNQLFLSLTVTQTDASRSTSGAYEDAKNYHSYHLVSQPANQSLNQTVTIVRQLIGHLVSQPVNKLVGQMISQLLVSQSVIHSFIHSVNQSISHLISKAVDSSAS